MTYVIDTRDDSDFSDLFDIAIEYADDDVDLLQLAMVLLEQMEMDREAECMLPVLAHSA